MSLFEQQIESIMVADCGSMTTKVVLLDIVDGQYRFIAYAQAPSTVNEPWEDVSIGVVNAIHRLEGATGRKLLDADEQIITPERADASGVDRFLVISSAARPLRIILAGLVRDVSLASARRAVLSTYATIEDVIALEHEPSQGRPRTNDEKINAIWHESPDVICVVGGTDGGAAKPVLEMIRNVVRVALYLMKENAPMVIYAGNAQLRETVTQQLKDIAPFQVVDNVRPAADVENIGPVHEEIEVIFYEQRMRFIPGINVLRTWSPSAILPAARAADYTIRYCERAWQTSKPALGVDVGSSSVSINVSYNGQSSTTIRTDLGVGCGLLGLLEQVDMRDITRWLPFEISESEARDRLLNKALHPGSIPQTREDLLLEQAATRELLRLTLQDSLPAWPGQAAGDGTEGALTQNPGSAVSTSPIPSAMHLGAQMIPPCEPIIASGGVLTGVPYQGHAALILLDALQPLGVSTIYLDEHNLVSSLGIAASIQPLATVQALRNGGLTYLGTVVVPIGRARRGDKVLTVKPVDKELSIRSDVTYGSLEAIPFQFFEPGTMLELIPSRGFDIGLGPGKSLKIRYRGGSVGLIIDARGRPLEFAGDPDVQRRRMDYWLWEMMSA